MKILFIAANTGSHDQLALDAEYRAIEQSIHAARHRDAFQLIPKLAARLSDLRQALLEHSPDVVHFACHGSPEAELVLLADGAEAAPVPAAALASLFRVLQDNLTLVVFNACFASEQAKAIRQSAGLAIGMRGRIEDRAAIEFAPALYGALAHGRSVQEAFDLGVAAIEAVEPQQKHLPQLYTRPGLDARIMYLVDGTRRARRFRILGAVVACASLALAGWYSRPGPGDVSAVLSAGAIQPPVPPVPSRGMARFPAGSIRPGVFAAAQRPQACASLTVAEDVAVLEHPENIAEIRLEPFDLDVLEVTNRDFAAWLNTHADQWKAGPHGVLETRQEPALPLVLESEECGGGLAIATDGRIRAGADQADWPVTCVTWYGAVEYCRAQGKRLPLELEWELAAKGQAGRPFPWGATLPRQDGVTFDRRDSAAAHPRDAGDSPQDVSPQGVRDLGGNVAEWVEDNQGINDVKTIRGGSWASRDPCHLLGSGRKRIPPGRFSKDVGFRCASSVIDGNLEGRRELR